MQRRTFLKTAALAFLVPFVPRPIRDTAADILEAPSDAPIGFMHRTTENFIINTDRGWIRCDGRQLSKKDYPELAGVIKNVYGGTKGDFKVPDMRRKHAA